MSWPGRTAGTSSPIRSDRLLVDSGPGIPPVSDHAVYGVYVTGAGLLYVGQTRDARRRLRDLPVGESHHLATTVPPETWERVLVIQWPALITRIRRRKHNEHSNWARPAAARASSTCSKSPAGPS